MILRCQVPGCNRVIKGMTGLQELQNLIKHMGKEHLLRLDMNAALEWRARFEEQQEAAK